MERSPILDQPAQVPLPFTVVSAILDCVEQPLLIADGEGRLCAMNRQGRRYLKAHGLNANRGANLFQDVFRVSPKTVLDQMRIGEHELSLPLADAGGNAARARIQLISEVGWIAVALGPAPETAPVEDAALDQTVNELVKEREVTYRNLLAAYLRLQDVNHQKTVFLASAAHELKTPLAVMKGYYDLLLSGSIGKLGEKQKEILNESKESCERLVRLVSMFLNYSALESGKLILQLRDNDLRECLAELSALWRDAFTRSRVRLETHIADQLAPFPFDYQKVQQTVASLFDNAMKHTPGGGQVILSAEPYFWERRAASLSPNVERRRFPESAWNSVMVSVEDSGPGIAPEHHQEIFEEFVRVDRTTTGMGLGLAIAKRLVQAHRGKIWVDSEIGRGCTVKFILPTDLE